MILHRYFARRYLAMFGSVFALFLAMMVFVDLIEQARRFGGDGVRLPSLLGLSLLNVPQAIYEILPLITMIATIALFLGLARSSEMVVTRASGRSALHALIAPVLMTALIGAAAVAGLNPIVAATSREYEARVGDLRGEARILALSEDGLWLRQGTDQGQTVIHAGRANLDGTELRAVTFVRLDAEGRPVERVEAESAALAEGRWQLRAAKIWPLRDSSNPERDAQVAQRLDIPSTLTADQIRDSFGDPEAIPIWELPAFISRLQLAGFSALRHQTWFQMELALPAFLVAMVLIGAGFTMRHQRGRNTGAMVLVAVLLGFGAYFVRNFAQVLGESGQIPPVLAAWAPPAAAIALALTLILHLEDG